MYLKKPVKKSLIAKQIFCSKPFLTSNLVFKIQILHINTEENGLLSKSRKTELEWILHLTE